MKRYIHTRARTHTHKGSDYVSQGIRERLSRDQRTSHKGSELERLTRD